MLGLRSALTLCVFLFWQPTWAIASEPVAAGEEAQPESGLWTTVYEPKLSELELPAETLGDGWKVSPGLRIDDFTDLSGLSGMQKSMAGVLAKQMGPLGVTAVGDYSLARTSGANNLVTVRVFVFVDAERCRDWWNLKYQAPSWREHYEPVEVETGVAADSIGANKRAIALGNLWLSAQQLGEGDEHLVALDHLLEALVGSGE